jgi:transcriptional regulator with XRE-family HTH domain
MPSRVGEKIRNLRKERGVSLDKLAEMTASSKSYLWELENKDNAKPSADKVAKIAEALKVSTEYLMDDRLTELDASEEDKAFYRKYRGLSPGTKRKLEKFLDMLEEDDD